MKKIATVLSIIVSTLWLYAADWTTYNTSNSGLAGNTVKVIVIDQSGNKWFGTDKGLSAFDGTNWVTYQKDENKQTLADDNINDMAFEVTSYGPELWIATENGVSVIAIPSIDAVTKATPYRTDNTGLISNTVTTVAVDTLRHERWFGTPNGVSRFNSSDWRNFDRNSNPALAWTNVTCIGVDPDSGWKYIGTINGEPENNGVARLRTSLDDVDAITAPSPYNAEWSGLWSSNIYSIHMDPDGSQWFGTDVGFAYHDTTETKAGWEFFTMADGLPDSVVQAIVRTDDRVMWIGTRKGVSKFRYKQGEWGIEKDVMLNFTTVDGLASNNVFDLAVDQDGSLWIATNNGVSHFTGNTAVQEQPQVVQPRTIGLVKNYPNPFNPSTTISYVLPSRAHVELTIMNMRGEKIRGLVNTSQSAGAYHVLWNGLLSDGRTAPTGIYIANLRIDGEDRTITDSIKMLMVK